MAQIKDWQTLRAMALLHAFGTHRLDDVRGVSYPLTLDHFAANTADVDQFVSLWLKEFPPLRHHATPGYRAFFFAEGGSAIPFEGPPLSHSST